MFSKFSAQRTGKKKLSTTSVNKKFFPKIMFLLFI